MSALQGIKSVLHGRFVAKPPVPQGNPQLSSQIFIVTGANGGLGFETSLHLSRLGVAKLIMAVRSVDKGEQAKRRVLQATGRPDGSIEVWPLDMNDPASIRAFAARVSGPAPGGRGVQGRQEQGRQGQGGLPRLDGVLANAGIMTTAFSLAGGPGPGGQQQHEATLNINVVNTTLLYLLLLPAMRASAASTGNACRFSVPNSALHHLAPLAELDPDPARGSMIDRLDDPARADMAGRYSLSKLLVLLVVRELAAAAEKGSGSGPVIVNTPNPSFCKSNLTHEQSGSAGFRIFERALARTAEEGSRVLVHGIAAAGPETHGQYLSNCQVDG